jgi:hypothetical protein
VEENGAPEDKLCMADVWRWDFHWQQLALYQDPLFVTPSDVLELRCTYDTTSRDAVTTWGEGTGDEMCLVFVYVTLAQGGPLQ